MSAPAKRSGGGALHSQRPKTIQSGVALAIALQKDNHPERGRSFLSLQLSLLSYFETFHLLCAL
jgi:hypothetical protein